MTNLLELEGLINRGIMEGPTGHRARGPRVQRLEARDCVGSDNSVRLDDSADGNVIL